MFYLDKGGATNALVDFIDAVDQDVTIVTGNAGNLYSAEQIEDALKNQAPSNKNKSILLVLGFLFRILILKFKPKNDVLITNDEKALLLLSLFRPKSKLIHILHTDVSHYSSFVLALLSRCFERCSSVICNSYHSKKTLEALTLTNCEMTVIYQPFEVFKGYKKFDESSTLKLIVLSRFSDDKNIDFLIDSLIELHDEYPTLEVQCNIYGSANLIKDVQVKKSLQEKINATSIGSLFLHEWQYDLEEIFEGSDALVSCSKIESFGRVAVEAMCHGVVPIVSRIPAHEEIVVNKVGYHFSLENNTELKEIIRSLALDKSPLRHKSRESIRYIEENFNRDYFKRRARDVFC